MLIFLLPWAALPLFYLLAMLYFIVTKRNSRAAKISFSSLVCYLIGIGVGSVGILSSRSSTAVVGFFFLPYYSFVLAVLGAAMVASKQLWLRAFFAVLILSFFGYAIFQDVKIKQLNETRDVESSRQDAEIEKNEKWVREIEQNEPDKASQIFMEKALGTKERTLLIPIASSKLASAELLDLLSRNQDLGVRLAVVRNQKASSDALERIFNSPTNNYFFADLARNPKTPEKILLQIFEKKNIDTGIQKGLAENRNIPNSLIPALLESQDPIALAELSRNPSVNCQVTIKARRKIESLSPKTPYFTTGMSWSQEAFERCQK